MEKAVVRMELRPRVVVVDVAAIDKLAAQYKAFTQKRTIFSYAE